MIRSTLPASGRCARTALTVLFTSGLAACDQRPAQRATASPAVETVGSASEPPSEFARDPSAQAQLKAVQDTIEQTGGSGVEGLATLRALYARYPTERAVADLYKQILVKLKDWNGLANMVRGKAPESQTEDDRLFLAKVLIKGHRHTEALDILVDLLTRRPDNAELQWLAGFAHFAIGEYEAAAPYFEHVIQHGRPELRVEAMILRALTRFYGDDAAGAVELLKPVLEVAPDNITAINAMARALTALGRDEEARAYLARLESTRNAMNEVEFRRSRLSNSARNLDDALEAKQFDRCDKLIAFMWPLADEAMREQLRHYQELVREGRKAAANAAGK